MQKTITTTSNIEINNDSMTKDLEINIKNSREFSTNLMNKEEVFKLLSLAETLRLPILLVGVPGTGKTNIVIDYTKGMFDLTNQDEVKHFNEDGVFMLETDEGTKSNEIKGVVDIEQLVINNKYQVNPFITKADTIIINEVDKASSSLRNSLLGIMNEKVLFNGRDKIPCKWKLFVATCNEIPREEINSPFWDRFQLKIPVNRLSSGECMEYFNRGAKNFSTKIKVTIPSMEEINKIHIPLDKLEKFIKVCYQQVSDRTITFVPLLTKAIRIIYNTTIDKALIKTCELLGDKILAEKLSKELLPIEKRTVLNKLDLILGMTSKDQILSAVKEIEEMVNNYSSQGKFNLEDMNEIKFLVEESTKDHPSFDHNLKSELQDDQAEIPSPF